MTDTNCTTVMPFHATPQVRHSICPDWCNDDHEQVFAEGNGMEDALAHRGRRLYEGHLFEIRTALRLLRPHAGGWFMQITQPANRMTGIELQVEQEDGWESGVVERATLALTSSEARTLASQLLALADVIDVGDPE